MNKPKLLIFIENDFTLRSYLETPVLDILREDYSLEGVLSFGGSDSNSSTVGGAIDWHRIEKEPLLQVLQTISAIKYWFNNQQKSNSFKIRILSLKKSRRVFYSSRKNREFPSISIFLGFLFAKAQLPIPNSLVWLAARRYRKFLVGCNPSAVICVTSGGATSNSDILAMAGKKLGFPVLTITENWDNLTSKAVFTTLPNYLGVWGTADQDAAVNLHGFDRENLFKLGSPRVSQLFQNQFRSREVEGQILFAGGSIDIEDDLGWFEQVHDLANQQKIGLVYVPHPSNYNSLADWIAFEGHSISQFIPTQILDLVTRKGIKRYPKLNFYDELLAHSTVVISPYSTLLLESLLLGIPTIGIDFRDPKELSLGWASEKFEHLQGLDYFDNYSRVRTRAELNKVIGLGTMDSDSILFQGQIKNMNSPCNPFYDFSQTFEKKLSGILKTVLASSGND